MSTLHRQVLVTSGELSDEVDEALAPLMELLWGAGIETVLSCQRHPPTGKVWIEFASGRDAEAFLNAVQKGGPPDEWWRAEHWYFGAYESSAEPRTLPISSPQHPAGWEFYASVHDLGTLQEPNFSIRVDVLFPTGDLDRIIGRARTFLGGADESG